MKQTFSESPHLPHRYAHISIDFRRIGAPIYLADRIQSFLSQGVNAFQLRIKKGTSDGPFYPNVCVPVAGIIDYYKNNFDCKFMPSRSWVRSEYLSNSGVLCPYVYEDHFPKGKFLDRVWMFDLDTNHSIVTGIVESIRSAGVYSKGVVFGLELALNEVVDNVLQHSLPIDQQHKAKGYVMAQYHRSGKRIAVSVFDTGQGIANSLSNGAGFPTPTRNTLEFALGKGNSDGLGAGNGLWMMDRIITESAGSFSLVSSGRKYEKRHKHDKRGPVITNSKRKTVNNETTLVDFQLMTGKTIELSDILEVEPIDLWREFHLSDDLQTITLSVQRESLGQGSRYAATRFANLVCNTVLSNECPCILDFAGTSMISASFADQLVCDLIRELGLLGMMSKLRFTNISPMNAGMLETCFQDRFFSKNDMICESN